MRVQLDNKELLVLFDALRVLGFNTVRLADNCSRSTRTVSDWKRGKHTMPKNQYDRLLRLANVKDSLFTPTLISEKELKQQAGKRGGEARYASAGPLGTANSRRKGGLRSYELRKDTDLMFKLNVITTPTKSKDLAEFIGIMIGDGAINDYQVSITCHMTDDAEYVKYISDLVETLFSITPKVHKRATRNCTVLLVSSKTLVESLMDFGLPKGNKIRANHAIPTWIYEKEEWITACLRGIFDTDGSIFLEKHKYKTNVYSYLRMSFVTASPPLRNAINQSLQSLGLDSRPGMNRSINLERFTDIEKYFKIVGSSNPKHVRRFIEYGEVA